MSKIDDVRNYTYRQIQFLIRQKETSVGKAMPIFVDAFEKHRESFRNCGEHF